MFSLLDMFGTCLDAGLLFDQRIRFCSPLLHTSFLNTAWLTHKEQSNAVETSLRADLEIERRPFGSTDCRR
jgi:hypothetical protein